jgi:hypothetical protein
MTRKLLVTAVLAVVLAAPAWDAVAGLYVYPANGQSPEKQKEDEGACLSWASGQTGFDPTEPIQASTPPPPAQAPTTNAGRGMLRGALLGTAVGAISGNTGKGAAIGAGTGLLVGGVRGSNQAAASNAQQQAWAQQQADQYAQLQNEFNRAYATCLSGRGYTVN